MSQNLNKKATKVDQSQYDSELDFQLANGGSEAVSHFVLSHSMLLGTSVASFSWISKLAATFYFINTWL